MRFPVVSRLAYDTLVAERDWLRAQVEQKDREILSLKVQGATPARAPQLPPVKLPVPDPEQRALEAHEQTFLENATQDFIRAGRSPEDARFLAEQIRGAVAFADSPVPFGH